MLIFAALVDCESTTKIVLNTSASTDADQFTLTIYELNSVVHEAYAMFWFLNAIFTATDYDTVRLMCDNWQANRSSTSSDSDAATRNERTTRKRKREKDATKQKTKSLKRQDLQWSGVIEDVPKRRKNVETDDSDLDDNELDETSVHSTFYASSDPEDAEDDEAPERGMSDTIAILSSATPSTDGNI